ncbi:SWI/SNF family DNA-dependent ATPase-like protein [Apiospora saccharicola]|uniref:SWI/SNF family DNA-dependent ATPase-like protein n=1 Tax=Apiospora saccharicola TaxID=335842 RepID=A0ABR1U828_9PEZI
MEQPLSPDPADDQTHGSGKPRAEMGADTPPGMKVNLMPHQRLGLEWLMQHEDDYGGSILADDVGLGKTIQTLALILARSAPEEANNKTTLLVVPLCLLEQWKKEIDEKIKPGELNVKIYHSDQARKPEQDWRHEKSGKKERARELNLLVPDTHFHRVVLDEAQLIEGLDSGRSQAVMELRTDFCLCLTSTPIMNSVDELYPLLRFLRIEPYKDQLVFNQKIGTPLGRLLATGKDDAPQEKSLSRRQHISNRIGSSSNSRISTEAALDTVHTLLEEIMLRRMKGDKINGQVIIDVPKRIDMHCPVKFSEGERDLYDRLEAAEGENSNHLTKEAASYLDGHTGLPPRIGASLSSAKVDAAIKLLQSIWLEDKSAKIIIFSGFAAFLDKFQALIRRGGFIRANKDFRLGRYDGKMTTKERSDALEDFEHRNAVLLMSTKAGGMGLNIHWATHLIFMEPEYNPYTEDQAIGRAHRVGQTKTVTVYRLFMETAEGSSMEEKIREKQRRKRELARLVLGDKEAISDSDRVSGV